MLRADNGKYSENNLCQRHTFHYKSHTNFPVTEPTFRSQKTANNKQTESFYGPTFAIYSTLYTKINFYFTQNNLVFL